MLVVHAAYATRLTCVASAGAVALALVCAAPPALAAPQSCRAAVLRASGQLGDTRIAAMQRCEERVVRGKLPLGIDCANEPRTRNAIAHATTRLEKIIARACGGKNHVCNATDTGSAHDDALDTIGWDLGHCPDLEASGCKGALTDCGDVSECLRCTSEAPLDGAIALTYGTLTLPTATTDTPLNLCQRALGRQMARLFIASSQTLRQCWSAVNRAKAGYTAPCPLGDPTGRTFARLKRAELRALLKVCAACGGVDKTCGGVGDFDAATIGFPATCPAVTVPGGASCGGTVSSLADLIECATCVTQYKVDCLTDVAVPWGVDYPAECNARCGDGVRQASEECDGADADACPGACQSDCTCGATATPVPTPVATPIAVVDCSAAPRGSCRRPVESGGARLVLDARKQRLVWRWTHGDLTTFADLGDPVGTSYALCVYDDAGAGAALRLEAHAPGGDMCDVEHPRPCWKSTHTGVRYFDKDMTPDGLRLIRIKEGPPGKARISVTGKGPELALPNIASIAQPVTVQLVNGAGACWEATFTAPAARHDGTIFRDTSD